MIDAIREKISSGERVNREEGLYLLQEANLLDLGTMAQEVRYRHNPETAVTFV